MSFQIGDRVIYKSQFIGTVRFIGQTKIYKLHFGIELDTSDGTLDGSISGVRYFSCKPKYGVFAMASQLKKMDSTNSDILKTKSYSIVDSKTQSDDVKKIESNEKPFSNESKFKAPSKISRPSYLSKPSNSEEKVSISKELNNKKPEVTRSCLNEEKPSNSKISMIKKPLSDIPINPKVDSNEDKDFIINDLKSKLNTLKDLKKRDLLQWKSTEQQFQVEMQSLKKDIFAKEKMIEEKQNQCDDLFKQLKTKEPSESDSNEIIEMLTIEKELAEEQFEETKIQLEILKSDYNDLEQQNELLKESLNGESTCDPLMKDKYESVIIKLKAAFDQVTTKNAELQSAQEIAIEQLLITENEIEKLSSANGQMEVKIKDLTDQLDNYKSCENIIESLTETNFQLDEENERLKQSLDSYEDKENHKSENNEEKNLNYQALKEELETIYQLNYELEAQFTMLKKDNDQLTGYHQQALQSIKQLRLVNQQKETERQTFVQRLEDCRKYTLRPGTTINHISDISKTIDQRLSQIKLNHYVYKYELFSRYAHCNIEKFSLLINTIEMQGFLRALVDKINFILENNCKMDSIDVANEFLNDSYLEKSSKFLLRYLRNCILSIQRSMSTCSINHLMYLVSRYGDLDRQSDIIDDLISKMKRDVQHPDLSLLLECINVFYQVANHNSSELSIYSIADLIGQSMLLFQDQIQRNRREIDKSNVIESIGLSKSLIETIVNQINDIEIIAKLIKQGGPYDCFININKIKDSKKLLELFQLIPGQCKEFEKLSINSNSEDESKVDDFKFAALSNYLSELQATLNVVSDSDTLYDTMKPPATALCIDINQQISKLHSAIIKHISELQSSPDRINQLLREIDQHKITLAEHHAQYQLLQLQVEYLQSKNNCLSEQLNSLELKHDTIIIQSPKNKFEAITEHVSDIQFAQCNVQHKSENPTNDNTSEKSNQLTTIFNYKQALSTQTSKLNEIRSKYYKQNLSKSSPLSIEMPSSVRNLPLEDLTDQLYSLMSKTKVIDLSQSNYQKMWQDHQINLCKLHDKYNTMKLSCLELSWSSQLIDSRCGKMDCCIATLNIGNAEPTTETKIDFSRDQLDKLCNIYFN